MFQIEFTAQAEGDLAWFKKYEQNIILDGIESNLRYEPNVETRNRKRLRSNSSTEWELRIQSYRIFYNVTDAVHIVSIDAVGLKKRSVLLFRGKKKQI